MVLLNISKFCCKNAEESKDLTQCGGGLFLYFFILSKCVLPYIPSNAEQMAGFLSNNYSVGGDLTSVRL